MALKKTKQEIDTLRLGGAILSQALGAAKAAVRPGVSIRELDQIAEQSIVRSGAKPSFKGYRSHRDDPAFPSTLCVSVNNEVVHGTADRDLILKEGDIVSLDIGCWYQGLCTDMAITVPVGQVSKEAEDLMRVTHESLLKGVEAALVGGYVSDISQAIENHIKPYGYGIVRDLVGHGVGHAVHESPQIPNFYHKRAPKIMLDEGMCIAIEPMVNMGDWQVYTAKDGWAVITKDKSLSAHFEMTIAIVEGGPIIITPLPL